MLNTSRVGGIHESVKMRLIVLLLYTRGIPYLHNKLILVWLMVGQNKKHVAAYSHLQQAVEEENEGQ